MTFDRILTSTPLNSTAGAVTGKSRDHYDPAVNFGDHMHWDAPPPCVALPHRAATFVDLTGRKFGRFTVVGYLGKLNPKKKSVWLVRCACGDYEGRHATAITGEANENAKCKKCQHWDAARKRYDTHGGRPIEDFVR